MQFVFNDAQATRSVCAGTYKTETALQAAAVAAIAAAVAGNETFSCTVACSGYSEQDVTNVVRILSANNFTTSYSGTTLTISW